MPSTSVYGLRYQSLTDPPDGAALGQNLAEDVEATLQGNLTLGGNLIVPGLLTVAGRETGAIKTAGINAARGADTTTSATYVNLAATSSFAFTKVTAGSALKVDFHIVSYSSGSDTVSRFAVSIAGTDYDIAQRYHNTANVHNQVSGSRVIAGLAAGALTIQGRWRRVSGTGTLTTDTADWLSIACTELPD